MIKVAQKRKRLSFSYQEITGIKPDEREIPGINIYGNL
jgi:hypothetical protein